MLCDMLSGVVLRGGGTLLPQPDVTLLCAGDGLLATRSIAAGDGGSAPLWPTAPKFWRARRQLIAALCHALAYRAVGGPDLRVDPARHPVLSPAEILAPSSAAPHRPSASATVETRPLVGVSTYVYGRVVSRTSCAVGPIYTVTRTERGRWPLHKAQSRHGRPCATRLRRVS